MASWEDAMGITGRERIKGPKYRLDVKIRQAGGILGR